MQTLTNVPAELISVVQGLIVVFVAAPRIINWLIDRGYKEAMWVKEIPREGTPHFLTLGTTLVTSVLAISVVSNYLSASNMLYQVAGGLAILGGIIGMLAFIYMFMRSDLGLNLAIIAAMVWFSMGIIGFLIPNTGLILFGILVGAVQAVFALVSILVLRKARESSDLQGGAN